MRVEMQYGRRSLTVECPSRAQVTVIRKPEMPLLPNPAAAVEAALDDPVECDPLTHLGQAATTACIAICDITRHVPNRLLLRPLIEQLMAAGMAPDQILVLVATGLHRPNEGEELAELIGDPWVLETVRVANHDARRDEDHVLVGETATRSTVVRLDRRFVEADLRIVTGLVEPHFMAGYSGGRKVVAPGLAHAETITTFHSARFMADPAAVNCNLHENPLHEEQLEIVQMLGAVYAVNTVIDEQRRLAFVNFGEVLASHADAVAFVRPFCEVSVPRAFPTVLTSAAGYPLDKTYYQTVKGMVGAMDILAPGGDLFVVSECSEGMGSAEFVDAQRRLVDLGPRAFLDSLLAKSHASVDEWQTQMQLKPMSVGKLHLYAPELTSADFALTGASRVVELTAEIEASLRRHGDAQLAVIPEGPYVVPRVAG